MIDKREILATAQQTSLTPPVVEKDYVLGRMLAGIYWHRAFAESWICKGSTCLKKCFFETYRFSEDFDFTLCNPEHLDATLLTRSFSETGEWIHDQTPDQHQDSGSQTVVPHRPVLPWINLAPGQNQLQTSRLIDLLPATYQARLYCLGTCL